MLASALLVTALEGGRPAVRRLVRRVLRWRVGLVWWLVAILGMPLLTVMIAVLLGDSARLPSAAVLGQEVVGVVVAFVLVNWWEKTAWAGFLQTRLERRHNFFVAAALTTIPFAAVHMPLQVVSGEARTATALAINFTLLAVLATVIRSFFGMLLRGAANSVLLVGLTHTFFNRSNNSDGIAADVLRGDSRQAAALLATAVLALVLGVILRAKLSRSYRLALDEAEHRRDA